MVFGMAALVLTKVAAVLTPQVLKATIDDLTVAVVTAGRTDVVRLDARAAVGAAHELRELQSLLSALLVAARTGDSLFGSCHD